MTLNLVKKEKTKGSNRVKFKRAGWNDDFLLKLLAQNSNAIALKENTDVRQKKTGQPEGCPVFSSFDLSISEL